MTNQRQVIVYYLDQLLLPGQLVVLDVEGLVELRHEELHVADLPQVLLAEGLQFRRQDVVVRVVDAQDELLVKQGLDRGS